uniref:Polyamine oxidase n=1 Tax=Nephromyces sp. MMRI TaxID=2496275 RepID=A0A3S8V396_9APIC|nr:polyamine oxidase [Nephromyces sp. MMRI]
MMSFNDHHGSPKMNMNLRHAPSQSYTIHAKYCLIALPLGVLIDSAHDRCDEIGNIQFYPPLSKAKRASLARYGMGVHNKIVMRFDPGQIFWRQQSPQLNCLDQRYQFLNLHAYGKVGCLLAHCFPPWSQGFGATDSDEMVVSDCCKVLQNMHGLTDEQMPAPVDYIVTRWHKDSFSRGSYSYPQVNSQDDDIFMLRVPSPIQNPRILFAGEYLSRSYYQCVDGAFDTGLRAAETIVHEGLGVPVPERTDNRPLSVDIFGVPDYKCPFTGFPLCKLDDESRCLYLTDGSDEGLSDIEGPDLDYPIEELDDGVVREERMYLTDACEAFRQERPIAFPDYVYHGLKALHFGESTSDTNCSALNGINLFSENISFSQEGDGSESIIEGTAPLPRRSRRLKVKESSSKKVTMSKYMQNLWTNDFCKNESKGITKSTSVGAAIALMEILKNQQGVNELYPVNEFDQKLELNELSGSQHDSLCWACLCGGEVLLCDGEGCRRVWHKDCVSPAPTADELLDGVEWICPACNGSDLPRGFDAAEKELQCYWKKRVWISKIKSNLAMCRKVFRRLAQHNVACVKHSAEAARIDSPLRDVKATGSTTDDLAI